MLFLLRLLVSRPSRNRIEAAAVERVAADESPDGERISLKDAVALDRLVPVVRAGRLKAAGPRPTARDVSLVEANRRQGCLFHAGVSPAAASSARMPALTSRSTTARFSC